MGWNRMAGLQSTTTKDDDLERAVLERLGRGSDNGAQPTPLERPVDRSMDFSPDLDTTDEEAGLTSTRGRVETDPAKIAAFEAMHPGEGANYDPEMERLYSAAKAKGLSRMGRPVSEDQYHALMAGISGAPRPVDRSADFSPDPDTTDEEAGLTSTTQRRGPQMRGSITVRPSTDEEVRGLNASIATPPAQESARHPGGSPQTEQVATAPVAVDHPAPAPISEEHGGGFDIAALLQRALGGGGDLAAAQVRAARDTGLNALGRQLSDAGSKIAHQQPSDTGAFDAADRTAQLPVEQAMQQRKMGMDSAHLAVQLQQAQLAQEREQRQTAALLNSLARNDRDFGQREEDRTRADTEAAFKDLGGSAGIEANSALEGAKAMLAKYPNGAAIPGLSSAQAMTRRVAGFLPHAAGGALELGADVVAGPEGMENQKIIRGLSQFVQKEVAGGRMNMQEIPIIQKLAGGGALTREELEDAIDRIGKMQRAKVQSVLTMHPRGAPLIRKANPSMTATEPAPTATAPAGPTRVRDKDGKVYRISDPADLAAALSEGAVRL